MLEKCFSVYVVCILAAIPSTLSQHQHSTPSQHIVCYISSFFMTKEHTESGLNPLETIDPHNCTIIIYGVGEIDNTTLLTTFHKLWSDFDERFDTRIAALQKRGILVSLAVGGSSAYKEFPRVVVNAERRRHFIEHAIRFLKRYNFDGLDLNWYFPVCELYVCDQDPVQKDQFKLFVEEMSREFKREDLLLSAVVGDTPSTVQKGYDVKHLSAHLDWITVRTIHYSTADDEQTGNCFQFIWHRSTL